jgi:hypothetical protein
VPKIGIPLGDPSVVQGKKTEPISATIEPPQIPHLGSAKIALAVVNNDVSGI